MALPERMKFGIFLGPFHRVGENPTLAMDRDLELIQWLDYLGYDEAWIGEHHSAGWEIISSPEIFMGVAADRTRHIKLGTGVVSLPYHHPLMVANRMTQLDHMTHGRVMFGVGPGALPGDAYMMGIDPTTQREKMDEALGIILRLFTETEPLTYKSDWFELNEAMLQIRPFQKPHMPIAVASVQSPAGVMLAGKYGASVLTITVPRAIRLRGNPTCVDCGTSPKSPLPSTGRRLTASTGGSPSPYTSPRIASRRSTRRGWALGASCANTPRRPTGARRHSTVRSKKS